MNYIATDFNTMGQGKIASVLFLKLVIYLFWKKILNPNTYKKVILKGKPLSDCIRVCVLAMLLVQ